MNNDCTVGTLFLAEAGTLLFIINFILALVFNQPPIQNVRPSLSRSRAKHMNLTTNFHLVPRLQVYGAILLSLPPPIVVIMWWLSTATNLSLEINEKAAVQHVHIYMQILIEGVYFCGINIFMKKSHTHIKKE
jgi:hypothetical protein